MAKSLIQKEIEAFEKRWDKKILAVQDKVIALEVKVDRIKSNRKQRQEGTITGFVDELEEKFKQMGIA